ncbi:MAG: hypothetical protein LBH31_04020 [Burkholderiaceae bacterium]|jgi:hypothetical protein|nr:hypothetical protein [Burkholderiaceae bacterium]
MVKPKKFADKNPKLNEAKRTKFLKIRCTHREYEQVRKRAASAGLTMSDYLRRAAFNHRILAKDVGAVIGELRRIGALIKHNYPTTGHWSEPQKRRYWQLHEQLWQLADQIACSIGLKNSK